MMKSRLFCALILGATITIVNGATAGAQSTGHAAPPVAAPESGASKRSISEQATLPSDSSHKYDAQALRFESSWGNLRIIRGANGPVVGTAGWFRTFDVEKLVAASPSARAEAQVYRRKNLQGSIVGGLGALTLGVGVIVAANSSNNASSPVLIIAGAGAMAWGAQHVSMAYSALSRTLWLYNRDLTR